MNENLPENLLEEEFLEFLELGPEPDHLPILHHQNAQDGIVIDAVASVLNPAIINANLQASRE